MLAGQQSSARWQLSPCVTHQGQKQYSHKTADNARPHSAFVKHTGSGIACTHTPCATCHALTAALRKVVT